MIDKILEVFKEYNISTVGQSHKRLKDFCVLIIDDDYELVSSYFVDNALWLTFKDDDIFHNYRLLFDVNVENSEMLGFSNYVYAGSVPVVLAVASVINLVDNINKGIKQ